jgi:bacillithiol biosynthesis cysteine-adding enzyme BshC
VADAGGPREIDGAGQLGNERQHLAHRGRRVMAQRHIERLGGDVLLRPVGHRPFDAGGDRFDDRGMKEPGLGRNGQRVRQALGLFGSNVETENLDGDETVTGRLVGPEDGTKRPDADLVQHPEGAESGRRCECRRVVSTQLLELLEAGSLECYTNLRGRSRRPNGPVTHLDSFASPLREYEAVAHVEEGAQPRRAAGGQDSCTGIEFGQLPWARPLATEYARNFAQVAPLYAGDPSSPEAWRTAIARAQQHPRQREAIGDLLLAQQARRAAPPEARAAATLLKHPDTVAVVTGQQAGSFGGPLFTLLKAITAIQLAQRTAAEHKVAAVALFWVDAEDHDWEEVRTSTVLDGNLRPRDIEFPAFEGAGRLPIAGLKMDDRVSAAIDELQAALAPSDFTSWVVDSARAAWRPGTGMADAFATWLETLLGPHGLVVFESSDPAAKPFVADLFARELQFPGRTSALAAEAGQQLAARGHQPQVVPQPDSVALFRMDGGRTPVRRRGDELVIGDAAFAPAALAAEAVEHPERFSPNVLLRPVVQDALFPTICYVAGPSELAYLGQLKGVYEHFGVPMPLMYPRASATLVDSATRRFLAKYDLHIEDLRQQDEAALNRLLESQLPAQVEEALGEADAALRRTLARVIEVVPAVDPTLAGAAKTTLGKIEHDLRSLHGKVIQAAKKKDETLRRQFVRAQSQVFPTGHPQERTLSVVFFLNRYGPALVDRLLEELPLEMGSHWLITI